MESVDIIRLAREAGLEILSLDGEDEVGCGDGYHIQTDLIERFAALVAAHEREECAKVCEAQITGHHFLATHGHFDHMDQSAMNCAAAIRSRT